MSPALPSPISAAVAVRKCLEPSDLAASLRHDVRYGLQRTPKELPPKWFYDDRGCELFDAITRLPEYYPTRRERTILAAHAGEIVALTGADTLVELGSGTSEKTRLLLDAMYSCGRLKRFVPLDVAESTVLEAAAAIVDEYPGVAVDAVIGDFERHLGSIPEGGRRLVAFLGGTIGNLYPAPRAQLLRNLAAMMRPGDALLLGTDLVKDVDRLVAAYDDAAGVTAEFNLNVLRVLNRELGADFDLAAFEHVALYDQAKERIEMRLRSSRVQDVDVPALGLRVHFGAGEEMRTEISTKFRLPNVAAELRRAGLRPVQCWTDPAGDFGVSLAVR